MKLILSVHGAVKLGVLLLRHHLCHYTPDFQREWGQGEVFLRCQRCGLVSTWCSTSDIGRERSAIPFGRSSLPAVRAIGSTNSPVAMMRRGEGSRLATIIFRAPS